MKGDRLLTAVVWAAMLLASSAPQVVVGELSGATAPWWLALAQVTAPPVLRLCGASDVLRWLLAMAAGWHLAVTVLVNGAPSSELVCFGR